MFSVPPNVLEQYASTAPIASIYVRIPYDAVAGGRQMAMLRWRAVRDGLATQGAPQATLQALDACVGAASPGDRMLVAMVRGATPALCLECATDDAAEATGRYGVLPYGLPLLRCYQSRPAYVVALVDRTGADLTAYHAGVDGTTHELSVEGPDDEIERNAPGGWSQLRYQHRAEDSWEHNAVQVARRLGALVQEVRAQAVLAAGDVRALQYLQDHLPRRVAELVRVVPADGIQAGHARAGVRPETIRKAITDVVHDRVGHMLHRLTESATAGVASGVDATVRAATEANVAILYVVDDPLDARVAFVGDRVTEIALIADESHPYEARLADALVRAVAGSGGEVVVFSTDDAVDLPAGVAAVLRHAEAPTVQE